MNGGCRIWLTGSSGQLGTALQSLFPSSEKYHWLTTTREEVDLRFAEQVAEFLASRRPNFIINAAAFTAVDRAETEREEAFCLNATLPEQLAQYGVPLIHISTDHVFGGLGSPSRTESYVESDAVCPANYYGETKALGEEKVRAVNPEVYILRTSWLYGPMDWGKSFYKSIRTNALAGKALKVVEDEVGTPTSTLTLARVIMAILERWDGGVAIPFGTYHVADLGETSRYDLAKSILALDEETSSVGCSPCLLSDLNSAARRPHYSALDTSKIQHYFQHLFRPWEEALKEVYYFESERDEA